MKLKINYLSSKTRGVEITKVKVMELRKGIKLGGTVREGGVSYSLLNEIYPFHRYGVEEGNVLGEFWFSFARIFITEVKTDTLNEPSLAFKKNAILLSLLEKIISIS